MQPIRHSNSWNRLRALLPTLFLLVSFIFCTGCASSRRQRDYVRLFRVIPGEEHNDFGRLAEWIAEHDGQITLSVGGAIHWEETVYYRWYSNETFVVLTCPPRFHESKSFVRWSAGSVAPLKRGVGWAMAGDYGVRGAGTHDFPGVTMCPSKATMDGVFGVRFGYSHEALLRLLAWHLSDQPLGNRLGSFEYNRSPKYQVFHFGWLLGYPGIHLDAYYTLDKKVGMISIRMPNSPSLAGLDFMKEDPPVIRKGSFIVDAELAAKGRRREPTSKRVPLTPSNTPLMRP